MREIKFRIWHKQYKEMYYWGGDAFVKKDRLCFTLENVFVDYKSDFIVMQYTGRKDKDGKEIYEGDIIAWDKSSLSGIGYVIFNSGSWCLKDNYMVEMFDSLGISRASIIGNIHEDEDILKELGL